MRISPTAEGFRAAFRRPSFALGEITWRWVVGTTATALFFFGFFEYLNTLPVTNGEMLLLKSRQPYLVAQVIAHILRGSLSRAVLSMTLAALLLVLLWMIAASLGRIATIGAMIDYVREQLARKAASAGVHVEGEPELEAVESSFAALVRLNFLRVSLAVATIVAFMGASILAGFASSDAHPRPGLVFLLFLPMAVLVGFAWFGLNWLLSLSSVFAVRDGRDAAGAIEAAVTLCRNRTGAVFAVSTWTGLAHLVAFVAATTAVSMPLGLAALLPWRLVVLGVIILTLVYFAVADWIYTARLAGYVAIVETPEELLRPTVLAIPQTPAAPAAQTASVQMPSIQTMIDKDEPILSDLPDPTTET